MTTFSRYSQPLPENFRSEAELIEEQDAYENTLTALSTYYQELGK